MQYINSFYSNNSNRENNNQLKLINNELIISNPLKNVSYNGSSSNYKNCTDSITGNSEFSYCGPTPYNF